MTLLGWPWPVLLAGLLVSLGAGVVRGFAGFGYSALCVAGLALFVAPATVVPAVLALEILASVSLMRGSLADADRDWLRPLLVGNLLFVPVGILVLVLLPETLLRLLVGAALLVSAVGLRLASRRVIPSTRALRIGAGVASGLLNGIAASGGVVAAMLMAAVRLPPAALRGTMVSFLMFAAGYALLCAVLVPAGAGTRLLGADTLRWGLLLAPTMLAGVWIGRHSFSRADPARYRGHVLTLLIVISALGTARAAIDLLAR